MGVLLQVVLAGLSVGAVYGLLGYGFSLVHRLTRVLAFAQGDIAVAAVLIAVLAVVGPTPVAAPIGVVRSAAVVVLGCLAGALLSAVCYAVAVRPFAGDVVGWVAAGITAGLLTQACLGVALPAGAYAVPDPLHLDRVHLADVARDGIVGLPGGATLPVRVLGVLLLGSLIALAADRFVVRSRAGLAIRAVADDRDAAALVGIATGRVVLGAFVLAGVLAAVAGLLTAPGQVLGVDAGVVLGLKGIAAALVGGLGDVRRSLGGGLAVGVAEQVAVATPALGAGFADVVPLAILVAVLALRPEGLRRAGQVPVE